MLLPWLTFSTVWTDPPLPNDDDIEYAWVITLDTIETVLTVSFEDDDI